MERTNSFGYWLRRQRKALDLTQDEMALRVGCALGTIRKIETDQRRPSKQLAERLATILDISSDQRTAFMKAARAELATDQLQTSQASNITLDRPSSNLPVPATRFIGRERELAALRDLICRDDVRLVTLTGPGGTGKSRLCVQVAASVLALFEHGVWFINLATVSDPNLVASTIADALGVREIAGHSIADLLKRYLREKRMLLLLDNFEHVVEAAPLVSELLAFAPDLKVLVTSRITLRLLTEREFAVLPLALPPTENQESRLIGGAVVPGSRFSDLSTAAELSQYEAVRLFIQRAQAVKADFVVRNENAPAVAEICYRLDGLPLAIELAAARVKMFPPQALLERLDSRLKFLTGGARDQPARQQTIRNTIDWSYNLLGEREKILFARLATFVGGCSLGGGCTLEAAEQVCNADGMLPLDVVDGIAALVDHSLLRQDESAEEGPRFVMLETIREYALERLEQRGEVEAVRRWHAEYFLKLAEQAEPELAGPRQVAWLARLDRDIDNLRAALGWSLEHHEIEMSLRLAGALALFWYTRSHWNEGRSWFEAALTRSDGASRSSRAKALLGAGQLATFQNDYEQAHRLCEQANALYMEQGDHAGAAWALFFQTIIAAQDLSAPGRSKASGAESLRLRRSIGDKRGIAYSLHLEGEDALYAGEFARAVELLDESLALFREVGDTYGTSLSLVVTAEAAYATGDYERAGNLGQECLKVSGQLGDRRGTGSTLELLGRVAHLQGEGTVAHALLSQALSLLSDAGDRWGMARCLESMAAIWANHDPGRAARLFGFTEQLRQSIGLPQTYLDRSRCERGMAAVGERADAATIKAAWAQGRALTLAQAIAEAVSAEPEGALV